MSRIKPVDRDGLDAETLSLLATKSNGGDTGWNVFEGIANNASTLRGIFALSDSINKSLGSLEHEVIAIEMALQNGCGYCLPTHRFVCHELGVDQADIDAMTRGELLQEQPQLMVLQQFVQSAMAKKGRIDDEGFADFQARGLSDEKMIAILSEIALYTFYNYFNRLAATEIDEPVLPHVSDQAAWVTEPDR